MADITEVPTKSQIKEYSDKYRGFVQITVRVTKESSLAYQVPYVLDDAQLYLLGLEDLGKVVIMSLVIDNCDITPIDIELFQEVLKIPSISHIPITMLTPLLPVLTGSSAAVTLNPDNWTLVLDGRFAKCCPRVECIECKFKRLVTPRLLLKHRSNVLFSCKKLGLVCFSFVQTHPCDELKFIESKDSEEKVENIVDDIGIMTKTNNSVIVSRHPSSSQPMFESSIHPSSSFNTLLNPSDAFNRGPRPDKVQYAVSTLNEREEYNDLVKENPNVFGIRALGKLAASDQAPKYAAEKSISAWTTWKSAWEGLFAKHGVSNPIAQAQVAMLSLKGEALDWWNARWQTHPDPYMTWDGLTTLLKVTFYPLDAQDNAFSAWNALEFKSNVLDFFSEVRKTFRTYPVSMEHLLSILSFHLGKGFVRKVKTRLASGVREELSIYELEAIADEVLTVDRVPSSYKSISNVINKNIDSSSRALSYSSKSIPKYAVPSPSSAPNKAFAVSSQSLLKPKEVKTAKSNLEKKKVAAIETVTSQVRRCFLCNDPSHFCYQCPDRKLEGCCICGGDHVWQNCLLLEGKFVRRQSAVRENAGIFVENVDVKVNNSEVNEIAELAVPDICWQTHEPLCLSSIDWKKDNLPIRLSCIHLPSYSRRLVYRCKVQDKNACCLFDPGANCSAMSLSWAEKHDVPCKLMNNVLSTAVQEKKQTKYMSFPVKFQLGDFCTNWVFCIVPDLSHDIFLGTDFSLRYRITYDPFDWSLIILGDSMNPHQFPSFLRKPLCENRTEIDQEVSLSATELVDSEDEEVEEENQLSSAVDQLLQRLPILSSYRELFFPMIGRPPKRMIDHNIVLKPNSQSVKHNPYPLPPAKNKAMIETVSELLVNDAIEPSYSPWSSPLLFVKKKDGGWRMCVDFRDVNSRTKHDAYPLPRINVLMQKLGNAKYFTKIDLASGFHQVPVRSECREITAFCTPQPINGYSHFQWKVMPFGLVNAPATFQRLMDNVLGGLMDRCIVYLDDILIYSKSIDEHHHSIRLIFNRLMEHKLYVKLSKCSFVQEEISFLGHIVGAGKVRIEPEKSEKICGWKPPLKSAKEVRKFWGLVSWCSMYIPQLASIAAPLTSLLGARRKFIWTEEAEQAMLFIQKKCLEAPVLVPWNSDQETRVTTDASDVGLGAVLEQKVDDVWRPVEFWSRKLKSAETRYSATDKEWLAVVEAVSTHWRHLLEGKKVIVRTDHRPLLTKLTSVSSIPPLLHRHSRWIERLSPFSVQYEHISGSDNVIADALSRTPEFYRVDALVIGLEDRMTLEGAIQQDSEYQNRAREIESSNTSSSTTYKGFRVKKNVILRPGGVIEVPNIPKFRTQLLSENHDQPLAGHFGRDRTLDLLRRKWFWKGMAKDVELYVQSCDKCNKVKSGGKKVLPPLQPIVANRPWSMVTLDFVGSFEPAAITGNTECLVMVDKFTKMIHLAACKKDTNAKDTAFLVIRHVVALHGIPDEILSDRGPQFDSQVWKDIWNILGSRVRLAAPQHPQTDGQSERSIRTFIQLMRAYTESQRDQWELFLPVFEFAMNNAISSVTGITPFFANFGRHPRTTDSFIVNEELLSGETIVGRDLRRRLQRVWNVMRERLQETAEQLIARSSNLSSPLIFNQGDRVYLSKKRGRGHLSKQEALYSGPYPVRKKLGKTTYILGGTPSAVPALQNVQHLRPFTSSPQKFEGRPQRVAEDPADEEEDEWEVEEILAHRGEGSNRRYLIKWKDSLENSWLPLRSLANCQDILHTYLKSKGLDKDLQALDKIGKLKTP